MKKFLKVFSVLALLCCCMFSFAGCDMFKEEESNEYTNLVAERKIVREVVNNTKVFLQSNLEQETEPVATSGSEISARALGADYWITNSMKHMSGIIDAINEVINDSDYIPGKLYNSEFTEETSEGGGTTYYYYISLNAYCGEGDMVTLNYSIAIGSKKGIVYSTSSVANAIDIYYNNEYQPIRFVECEAGNDDNANFTDIRFSETGEFERLHCAQWHTYENNGVVEIRRMVDVNKNGEVTDLEEYSNRPETECFTEEMSETFETEIEFVKERTHLYSFARPLSKETFDRFMEAMNRSETE